MTGKTQVQIKVESILISIDLDRDFITDVLHAINDHLSWPEPLHIPGWRSIQAALDADDEDIPKTWTSDAILDKIVSNWIASYIPALGANEPKYDAFKELLLGALRCNLVWGLIGRKIGLLDWGRNPFLKASGDDFERYLELLYSTESCERRLQNFTNFLFGHIIWFIYENYCVQRRDFTSIKGSHPTVSRA